MTATALNTDIIASLPQLSVSTRLRSPRGVTEYTFEGALLFDYLRAAGLMTVGPSANQYVVATAEDGFVIAVAMAEVAPGFSDKQVMLATQQNGEAIRAGVRLVVPGDDLGGRSVYGLSGLEVRAIESKDLSDAPASDTIELRGGLDRPGRVDADALLAMPRTILQTRPSKGHNDVVRPGQSFTGVLVWDLLDNAGIRLDDTLHEPFMRKVVIARDGDGYGVVIAGGELDPRFLNAPFIVAPTSDTNPGLRLIAPYDIAGARSVKGIASLEVRDA
jgi:molybdopterin-dependent oxidoreductase-like protein protein